MGRKRKEDQTIEDWEEKNKNDRAGQWKLGKERKRGTGQGNGSLERKGKEDQTIKDWEGKNKKDRAEQ